MAQNIAAAVIAQHLEIAVLGRQPAIQHLPHLHTALAQPETPRGFFAPITAITFNPDIVHSIIIIGFFNTCNLC
jgi:hypothetical protein